MSVSRLSPLSPFPLIASLACSDDEPLRSSDPRSSKVGVSRDHFLSAIASGDFLMGIVCWRMYGAMLGKRSGKSIIGTGFKTWEAHLNLFAMSDSLSGSLNEFEK